MKGFIFDIQRFSIHDGPGIRTVIFFKGCQLDCPWCCNPESINNFPEIGYEINRCIKCKDCQISCKKEAINFVKDILHLDRSKCDNCGLCVDNCYAGALRLFGKYVTVEELIETVLKDKAFYDSSNGGVTISGGEPLEQVEFLENLLIKLKSNNINTAIETSGYCDFLFLKKIIPFLDYILFDLKIFDSQKHKGVIGKDNKIIRKNFLKLGRYNVGIIVRVPVIPGFTDDKSNLLNIINLIKLNIKVKEIHFLPYHRLGMNKYKQLGKNYKMKNIKPIVNFKLSNDLLKILRNSKIPYKISG